MLMAAEFLVIQAIGRLRERAAMVTDRDRRPGTGGAMSILQQRAACRRELFSLLGVQPRVVQVEGPDLTGDDGGDDGPRRPLVIGGDDVPRGPAGAGVGDGLLVRAAVVRPPSPLA